MGDEPVASSWCEIDLARLARNLELTLGLLPEGASFCAVLKSDAYGHGIARVVPVLVAQGVGCVGITSNAEARAVRAAGFEGRLIRLRAAAPVEMAQAVADRVEEQIGAVQAALPPGDGGLHLALDSGGMARDGLDLSVASGRSGALRLIDRLGPRLVGISTHFSDNEPASLDAASDRFRREVDWLCAEAGLDRDRLLVHAGSTLTLLSKADVPSDMYRCGAILYGFLRPDLGYRPTMALRARVVHLGDYPEGASVGYDSVHRLEQARRLACISVGYAAGYGRAAAGAGVVLIRGKAVPVLGKVSMNSIIADVTDLPEIDVGDVATIFGEDGPAETQHDETVARFGTIMADLMTDWGLRNPRIYRGAGQA